MDLKPWRAVAVPTVLGAWARSNKLSSRLCFARPRRASIEIQAESHLGFDDSLQRAVKENCKVLKFKNAEFEPGAKAGSAAGTADLPGPKVADLVQLAKWRAKTVRTTGSFAAAQISWILWAALGAGPNFWAACNAALCAARTSPPVIS
jgi:hypothetical protein